MEINSGKLVIFFSILLMSLITNNSYARIKVLKETPNELVLKLSSKYIMGDLDNTADAKLHAIVDGKRKASEYAGTLIESETIVEDYEVTDDFVKTYTAAFMKTEELGVTKEVTKSGAIKLIVNLRIDVDKKRLLNKIDSIAGNKKGVSNVSSVSQQNDNLYHEYNKISRQIKMSDATVKSDEITELMHKRSKLLVQLNSQFTGLSKGIDNLSEFVKSSHLEISNLLKESNQLLKEGNVQRTESNKHLGRTAKAVFFKPETVSNALQLGEIDTLKIFRDEGKDLSIVTRKSMNLPTFDAMIINALSQNHSNIDTVLDYLHTHDYLDLDGYYDVGIINQGVSAMWNAYVKDINDADDIKKRKVEVKYQNEYAIYKRKARDYKIAEAKARKTTFEIVTNSEKRLDYGDVFSQQMNALGASSRPSLPTKDSVSYISRSPVQKGVISLYAAAKWANNIKAQKYLIEKDVENTSVKLTLANGKELFRDLAD